MGCGCNKKNAIRQNRAFRPTASVRPIQGGPAAGLTPQQVRALEAQANPAISPKRLEKMDIQRRRIEQLRRNAIKRKLG